MNTNTTTAPQTSSVSLTCGPRAASPERNGIEQRAQATEFRFLRIREVMKMCGKSRSSIYAAVKKGEFPPPVKLGEHTSAWVMSEILNWAEACITATRSK